VQNFADRLFAAVAAKESPLVVGIDPDPRMIPPALFGRPRAGEPMREFLARGVVRFAEAIVAAVAPHAAAIKPQLAYFERLGPAGIAAYEATVACAKACDLLVIADGKRNDIASTASQYAAAYLGGTGDGSRDVRNAGVGTSASGSSALASGELEEWLAGADGEAPKADALTVNGYLGQDSLKPFIERLGMGSGLFVLVKTSNPSSGDLQDRLLQGEGGGWTAEGKSGPRGASGAEGAGEGCEQAPDVPTGLTVAALVGGWLEEYNRAHTGASGYGPLGAVVGATYPKELADLRRRLVHTPFLIPGFGAQGGGVDDVVGGFDRRGLGAVVNASRSILYAYREAGELPFDKAAERKAKEIKETLRKACQSL